MDILEKQRLTNILIIILVIINIGCLSFIWIREMNRPGMAPPPPDRENVNRYLDKELNLNPDQEKQFMAIRKEHFETTRIFEDHISRLRKDILSESFALNPDMQKISQLADSIGSLQKGYELFLSQHFQKLASICSPEQKQKLMNIFLSSFDPNGMPPMQPNGKREMHPGPPMPPH